MWDCRSFNFNHSYFHPYVGLPYTVRSFMIVIVAGLGNLPAVALSGMGLGLFEEFADYILGTEFRIGKTIAEKIINA